MQCIYCKAVSIVCGAGLPYIERTKQEDKLRDEHVKYKERIAFSTMRASIPDWQPPSNWNSLTNKQKLDRLDKLQSV